MIEKNFKVKRIIQVKNYSCVPACLEQILDYYKRAVNQKEILDSLEYPERGMSLSKAGTFLISKNLKTKIITNNINIFDPSWFSFGNKNLIIQLKKRKKYLNIVDKSIVDDYIEYLEFGGEIAFDTISTSLLVNLIKENKPIIAEVASTYLYQKSKTTIPGKFNNSVKGDIEGHGVVISGYKEKDSKFKITDPGKYNPYQNDGNYWIDENLLIASIFIADGKSILYCK